ncbi:uncharacterized protein KY384_001963 [Bacidia gigantensis]|uniref:uncharacterized protein n=1 Tax=Bacidia gigantensis TaxID=2732470 RepID=UPI001D050EF1|nr:uncharacterized protein KY384_001963 [Bacidia gigantensis]KAG8533180.1 hypothetical protein KY384_001963 [Bacidia gigantensis]
MGWLWGSKDDESSKRDPFKDLDPSLQDFLIKESPVKYQPTAPPPRTVQETEPQHESPSEQPKVPPQSLFQDGRYAHLWKNYRPLWEINNENKSDQEKLADVLDGYKDRKAQIGKAALENCCVEHATVVDCYENGTYMEKMNMCRAKKKPFERCYMMQTRFLKALGYLASFEREAWVDEDIQMHADMLYHRMLDQEKAIEEAQKAGKPIPEFDSLEPASQALKGQMQPPGPVTGAILEIDGLPQLSQDTKELLTPEAQLALRRKLKGVNPIEREVLEKSTVSDMMSALQTGDDFLEIRSRMTVARRKRRAEGKGSMSDTISGWLGW